MTEMPSIDSAAVVWSAPAGERRGRPLLVLLTLAMCFGGYELIRRVRVLRPLFGLKAMSHTAAPRPLHQPVP